jgi:hypothetical protein
MSFDFRSFLAALKLSFINLSKLSLRRQIILLLFVISYPIFIILGRLGLLLDKTFFPECKSQEIKMPLHIMGNPRSGTTFIFNLFCLDQKTFSYLTLYDIIFPSIIIRKVLGGFSLIDSYLGGYVKKLIVKIDSFVFHGIKDIHPTGIYRPEEDAMLFIHTFLTPILFLVFPFIDALPNLKMFLDNLSDKERNIYINFYEECVKAHIYKTGGDKRLLSKNVYMIGSIKTLVEKFPDIKILYIIRNPYEAVSSFQSMLYAFSRFLAPEIEKNSSEMQEVAKLGREYYSYGYNLLKEVSKDRVMVVKYEDLVRDPKKVVEDSYAWMGLEMDPEFAMKLEAKLSKTKEFKSKHAYNPEEFGTYEESIYNEFNEVFQRYGFARSTPR